VDKEHRSYHGKYFLTLVFASLILVSLCMISHNAFADQVVTTIPVGSSPSWVEINPVTNEIYVANSGSNTISVINGSTNSVTSTIPVTYSPESIAVNPITNMIYVVEGKQNLAIINGSTKTVVGDIAVPCYCDAGAQSSQVAVNPVTNIIYVTSHSTEHFGYQIDESGTVAVINGTTNTPITGVNVSARLYGVAVNQNTNKIYASSIAIAYVNQNFVYAIDGSTNSVLDNVSLPYSPVFIATNPSTNMIYASESDGGRLAVIDGSSDKIIAQIPVGNSPAGVAVNPNENKIYVADSGNNTASVIDGSSNQVLEIIPVGSGPSYVDVNPSTNKIYVTNGGSNTVSVIDGSTPITPTVPPAPRNLHAVSDNSQVRLNWSPPSSNGGSTITNYKLYRGTSSASETFLTQLGNVNSYNDTTVTNGQIYFYDITAVNSVGESVSSNEASATPSSQIIFHDDYSSTAGWTQIGIDVTVDHPQFPNMVKFNYFRGGYEERVYKQFAVALPSTWTAEFNYEYAYCSTSAGHCRNFNVFDLTGTSDMPDSQPLTNVIMIDHGNGSNTSGANPLFVKTYSGSSSGITIQPNVQYYVRLERMPTQLVLSVFSDPARTIQISGSPVSLPLSSTDYNDLNYIQHDASHQPTASWLNAQITNTTIYTTPTITQTTSQLTVNSQDNNGNPITGFYTELYASNGTQIATGYTPYNFTLNNGQNYTVHVEDYGNYQFDHWTDTESTDANRAMSIINDTQITAVYKTIPQPPTGLTATAQLLKINLSWNVPSDNGGTPITGYMIERSTDNGNTWSTLVANTGDTGTTYSDTNVLPLTTYTYRVSAINDVGTSDPSNTASASTPSVGPVTLPSLP
jgi:YVTN family beta-propeller protein